MRQWMSNRHPHDPHESADNRWVGWEALVANGHTGVIPIISAPVKPDVESRVSNNIDSRSVL